MAKNNESELTKVLSELSLELSQINSANQDIEPVELEEFLYSEDYMKLPKLSDRQLEALTVLDDDNLNTNKILEAVLIWGKGSKLYDSKIPSPDGNEYKIGELADQNKSIDLYSYNEETKQIEIEKSHVPFWKGKEMVYEIELEDGTKTKVSRDHQFLTKNGWKKLSELSEGDEILSYDT
jgi:hypothetical protein